MLRFSNLSCIETEYEDSCTFSVDNDDNLIDIGLINAIRRIIVSGIKVTMIDRETIQFEKNTSVLHDVYLGRRLELIPVKASLFETHPYETLELSFKKKNETDATISVFVHEFKVREIYSNEEIPLAEVFPSQKVLFTKLKPGEELSFIATFKEATAIEQGSPFSPVCKSIYTFLPDEEEIAKRLNAVEGDFAKESFRLQEAPQYYKKNSQQQPAGYLFAIEGVGIYPARNLFRLGMTTLIDKMNEIKTRINENQDASIGKPDIKMDAVHLIISKENETVGNLVSSYHRRFKGVAASGYQIPHPEEENLVIRSVLDEPGPQDIEKNKETLLVTIDNIVEIIEGLIVEWDSFTTKGKKTPKTKVAAEVATAAEAVASGETAPVKKTKKGKKTTEPSKEEAPPKEEALPIAEPPPTEEAPPVEDAPLIAEAPPVGESTATVKKTKKGKKATVEEAVPPQPEVEEAASPQPEAVAVEQETKSAKKTVKSKKIAEQKTVEQETESVKKPKKGKTPVASRG